MCDLILSFYLIIGLLISIYILSDGSDSFNGCITSVLVMFLWPLYILFKMISKVTTKMT